MKRVMLYFGSFNPIHKGHIALAEYAVEKGLCDELVLVVSPQSPYKQAEELAPEMDRFEMAETACAASRYPDRIKPSVVEFLLPKPSYTIDTLRYLAENHGADMEFSILMGADQIERLDGWKEYDRILEYPVYVYPRRGEGWTGSPAASWCWKTRRCRIFPRHKSANASGGARMSRRCSTRASPTTSAARGCGTRRPANRP